MAATRRRQRFPLRHRVQVVRRTLVILALVAALGLSGNLARPTNEPDLRVLSDSGVIQQSDHLAFDACQAVTISEMHTWWNDSPYGAYGFYLDVLNGTCFYPSSAFLASIQTQGWNVIPIFSGHQVPQACYPAGQPYPGYSAVLSSDLNTDGNLGSQDAAAAIYTATAAGIFSDSAIFIDMEAYAPNQSDNGVSCDSIVNAYLSSWVATLQDRYCGVGGNHYPCPYRTGIYALPAASDIASFQSFNGAPGQIWGAEANGASSTWNFANVPNTDWYTDQRIHQFVGDEYQTYGGVRLLIDVDCVNGLMDGTDGLWGESGSEASEYYSSGDDPGC
jgi:hypothetical protein